MGAQKRVSLVRSPADEFPGLRTSAYRATSPFDWRYNCIAWAVGETNQWLWPGPPDRSDWPTGIPYVETIEAFEALFVLFGFSPCQSEFHEDGIEKVALFASDANAPTHAARQFPNGKWTSKLGMAEDIEHELRALEGALYGRVVRIYRRPAPSVTVTPP
jgi:hypothetical protein